MEQDSLEDIEIDDSLYSRQRYVFGDEAMKSMSRSNVFMSGVSGLGVETAKNLVLAGIKSLTIHDTNEVDFSHLATQFFLSEEDIGKNISEITVPKLRELNPYVKVDVCPEKSELQDFDLNFFLNFQCVILLGCSIETQIKVNNFCHENKIGFISGSTNGLYCWCFTDFGENFEIIDPNGEENIEEFINDISKDFVIDCLEHHMHGLETNDFVKFSEIKGNCGNILNEKLFQIEVVNPYSFKIKDTKDFENLDSENFYESGGIFKQQKTKIIENYETLEKTINNPEILISDFAKFESPLQLHSLNLGTNQFKNEIGYFPKPWDKEDSKKLIEIIKKIYIEQLNQNLETLSLEFLEKLSFTFEGQLAPLSAFLGGFLAQETLKSITGKFTPLKQWFYFDCIELYPKKEVNILNLNKKDRQYSHNICLGEETMINLEKAKLFLVGAGAIGCEMLKNLALLGIGDKKKEGKIIVTDMDIIEKSNLNRQFLFRPKDIQKPKSNTAANSAMIMNPNLNIEPLLKRVGPQTIDYFSDKFFSNLDCVINALDNIQARLYVDQRCVTNCKPLLESGTLATKGHVQVILPHLTESYSSQRDPPEKDVPFCTLKSFPNIIDHCIQWSRDKFETLFSIKPAEVNKVFQDKEYIRELIKNASQKMQSIRHVVNLLKKRPNNFEDCVKFSRIKFENYFTNNILQLLETFPVDMKTKDGALFWQSPKRPPTPLKFNPEDKSHMDFIESTSCLWATIFKIKIPENFTNNDLISYCENVELPVFQFKKDKKVHTDENSTPEETKYGQDDVKEKLGELRKLVVSGSRKLLKEEEFEKDHDENRHIDFITACSNLRAQNYNIQNADRLKTKKIAGKIVPAIATTTSSVSGLVTLELIKILNKQFENLESFKNNFLNLALPVFALSEPLTVEKIPITEDVFYTLWDNWDLDLKKDATLQEIVDYFQAEKKLTVSGILQGVKMIYVPVMGHKSRLPNKMSELLTISESNKEYTDLVITYVNQKKEEVNGPIVRYFLNL